MELYMVAKVKDGIMTGDFLASGRPCTTRVFQSIESAKRGIKQKGKWYNSQGYTLKIVKITRIEEVIE